MPDPEDINLENTPVSIPPEAKGDSRPAGDSTVDYEKRYKGLQRTYETLQAKMNKLQEQYDQLVAEAEGLRQSIRTHEGEKATLSTNLKTLETERDNLNKQISTHSLQQERMKLILREYPDLANFEAQGLLPNADTLEDLKPKLDTFRSTLTGMVGDNVRNKLSGSVPSVGSNNGGNVVRSKETVYAELERLAGSRTTEDRNKYAALLKEWDELNK
jgi:chromosome segregation ATPase